MSDVDGHELTVEIDEAFPFRRPKVDAFRAGHWNWINLGLGGPLEQGVLLGEIDDLFAGHGWSGSRGGHGVPFLAPRTRRISGRINKCETTKDPKYHEANLCLELA